MSAIWTPHLDPGERILWEGRPSDRLFLLRGADLFMVPYSLAFTGILAWMILPTFPDENAAPLLSVLVLGFGLYLIFGRFFHDRYRRRRTVYALNDRRAFIARQDTDRAPQTKVLDRSVPVAVVTGRNGRVTFGPPPRSFSYRWPAELYLGQDGSFTFRGLEDPEAVFALVQSLRREQAT